MDNEAQRVGDKRGHPLFHKILDELGRVHDAKNYDYTAGTIGGPLSNFIRTSRIMKLYPGMDWNSEFGVAMAYMLKQLDAALTLRSQKRHSVTGEPIGMRLKDVAIYSVIGMILEAEETPYGADRLNTVGKQRPDNSTAGQVGAPSPADVQQEMSQVQQPLRNRPDTGWRDRP